MSRIGKLPIDVPSGVEVKLNADAVEVKGPKGALSIPTHPKLKFELEDGKLTLTRVDDSREAKAQHGLRRSLLANNILGVTKGFEKTLEVVGVGYKVQVQGKTVLLSVGFSHQVDFALPQGVEAKAEGSKLTISGIDKQLVGETAAKIRRIRPPEPYKGKGIKYVDEQIRRKAGKSGAK